MRKLLRKIILNPLLYDVIWPTRVVGLNVGLQRMFAGLLSESSTGCSVAAIDVEGTGWS